MAKKIKKSAKLPPGQPTWSALRLPAPAIEGQTMTVSASVPEILVQSVRKAIGSREFSMFVTRALERELLRLNRLRFVEETERVTGPLDPDEIEHARRAILE
jgi:hypothetical protein